MIYIGGVKIESILVFLFLLFSYWSCTSQEPGPKSDEIMDNRLPNILTDKDINTGAERMDAYLPHLLDKRVAVVVNQTSMVGEKHLVDTLLNRGIHIEVIFAPEHGFRGEADAGAVISDGRDPLSGVEIVSLYGKHKKPTAAQLHNIEIVLFDIQDVGVRFYTYLSTMSYVMEACAALNIPFLLLDRPNPNGYYVDGPVLELDYKSFVGMHPIPVVHGMTFGELAHMIKNEGWADCTNLMLQVISCEGYNHHSTYELPIKPSPNLPNLQAILLYPSICFFEPTEYSIGRGTDMQFQVIGRPMAIEGDFYFTPVPQPGAKHPKHKGVQCRGVDLRTYEKIELLKNKKLELSFILKRLAGENAARITNPSFFDKLAGTDKLREALKEGLTEEAIRSSWEPALSEFKLLRNNYLLYPAY